MRRLLCRSLLALALVSLLGACAAKPPKPDSSGLKPEAALNTQSQSFLRECRAREAMIKGRAGDLKKMAATITAEKALAIYNELELTLDDGINRAGLFQQVHPDADLRQAGLICEAELSDLGTQLLLDTQLYRVFAALETQSIAKNPEALRYLAKTLRDFKRGGVDKDEATRLKVRALNKRMTELSQLYDKNLSADTRKIAVKDPARLKGLPADYLASHKPDANGVVTLTTDWPDMYPVMLYAEDAELRRELYTLSWDLGYPQNAQVFKDLLAVRYDIATTLGYANWAAYATEEQMIKTPQAAQSFIDQVAAISENRMKRDVAELLAYKKRAEPAAQQVFAYEHRVLERLVSEEKFHYSPEMARPYFDLARVKQGILDESSKLFGIRFVPVKDAQRWHSDVDVYDVLEGDTTFARIYLDLYPRENKYKSFAMFPILRGVKDLRPAEAAIVGNFPAPTGGPTYVDHLDVTTFFHEFGHLLHHILSGRQTYSRFSGTATEWDFVETPSQLYEEWAWDPTVLQRFAINAKGETIPLDLVAKMRDADEFGKGTMVRQQMYYAALSVGLYNQVPTNLDPDAFQRQMEAKYSPWPAVAGVHPICGFTHLVGYSSNYYTYMWSLSIAKDIKTAFKAKGLEDPETALRYRRTILDRGGAEDASDLVRAFLGRNNNLDAFKDYLEKGERATLPL